MTVIAQRSGGAGHLVALAAWSPGPCARPARHAPPAIASLAAGCRGLASGLGGQNGGFEGIPVCREFLAEPSSVFSGFPGGLNDQATQGARGSILCQRLAFCMVPIENESIGALAVLITTGMQFVHGAPNR